MTTRVKVFQTNPQNPTGHVDRDLEEQINAWLAEKPGLRVVSIQTTSLPPLPHEKQTSGSVLCLLFYAETQIEGDRRAGFLRE